ncbi:FAD-dependent oxidoreductase [Nitrincola alkalilacustris]|uniref:FAD-dependent oxidoreductase n=1 Tax=Nitrincola alkalilacustris TaxID=1571224 RepID=UPI00124CFFD7|nr:FAD-dependent oxidoreductase [Nitrincola alkalilacustris]
MKKKLLIITALILFLLVAWQQSWLSLLSLENLKAQQLVLEGWRDQHPLLSSLVFFGIYVLVTALSLPGAAVMTLAGGAIFGLLWGLALVSFASTLGATLAMLVSRYLLGDWVRRRFAGRMQAIDAGVAREGGFYLFTLRLVPLFPFFVINLVMGLTKMRVWTYWWVSQVGMLAGTLVYVNAGTQLARIDSLSGILSIELLGAFALLGVFPLLARRIVDRVKAHRVYQGWSKPKRFDRNLIVIGAGSGGLVSAYIAAAVKAKVTLVEQHKMGGDCLNTGCVPSKAIIRSARLAQEMRNADHYGLGKAQPEIDFSRVMQRVHQVIDTIEPHDSVERYTKLGVEVLQGRAEVISPWEVKITSADGTEQVLSARSIIVATGARPAVPDLPGLDQVEYLTSDNLWQLEKLPERLLVLGGGPIGCELAQAFARLGSRVTQVQRNARLMPREDEEASALVMQRFRAEGIELYLNTKALRFETRGDEQVLIAASPEGELVLPFDRLLLALGRRANVSGFGLEALGIEARDNGTLDSNGFLQTRFPNIYVVGDVTGPYQFTHVAAHQAWYASVNALFSGFKSFKVDYRVIPWATFTDPEVAHVGLNEQEAQAKGIPYEVTRFGIDDLDRAIADGEAYGFVKVLTVPGKDRILGVTLVGNHSGDLIAEYVLAMKHGIGLNKLLGTIHIYPTMAEANKYAAGEWKRAHVPHRVLAWVERFHYWRLG